jgi:maleate cis-trans isomerase
VFVSRTNLLVMDQVQQLEAELGKPIVTSNQASLWAALNRLGLQTADVACGRLFTVAAS